MRSLIVAVVTAISLSGCISIVEHARPERLPIVDFHTHLNGDMEAKRLLELMDRTGVRTMVLMARYYALGPWGRCVLRSITLCFKKQKMKGHTNRVRTYKGDIL